MNTNYWAMVWQQFRQKRFALLGLIFVFILFAVALLAPLLVNSSPLYLKYEGKGYSPVLAQITGSGTLPESLQDTDLRTLKKEGYRRIMPLVPYSPTEYDLSSILLPPSAKHWLGTDDQGRDVLARLIYGSRVSLSVGFIAVSIYVFIGLFFGTLAGYFGGWVDLVISRLIEIMICFPTFFLILTVLAFIGPSIYNIMFVIGITSWTGIARLARGEFLKFRHQDFVLAAKTLGTSTHRIILKHILPNSLAPILVSATFGVAAAILVESSLSFLGFGVQPPTPSWGETLSQSRDFMDIAWWLTLFPGLAIFLTITAYNLVGEGLRDAIDPKLKI
jgi:peptide/nickel transport system permease protein